MKLRKVMALSLAGAMAVSLGACGGGGGSESGGDSGSGGGDGSLSVMIWDTYQEPGLTEILNDFTEETGIEAEIQVVTWDDYWTLLSAGAQGGSMPDVFWMHSNEAERYMSNEMLLDLTDRIAESDSIDMSKYPEDITELYTYDGKNYAIPKDVDTIALWYNKTLFDEAGLAYPTADWAWDDLYEAAKALTKDGVYGFGCSATNNQAGYYNLIYDMGGYVINDDKTASGYDDPNTIKAMQYFEKMIQEGIMPSQQTMSESAEDVLLGSGTLAMATQGSWMLSAFKENEYIAQNCDCVELPKDAASGKRVSIYNGLGWAASADFNLQAYLNMMDDMVIRPYSRETVTWENDVNEELKKGWTQEVTMEEACMNAAATMNETLDEENAG
ncbi:ABC transporter substrate-binding protein [Blautia sp. An46]|uniref:ABC transporter substrate-binding protein n=1 Tax=Blautia sp. An46 TaxID=1965636 RepID=UPI000B37EF26|nr:sugar ABC transporter substrate-binding protein [Blautia sp. An46]OUN93698.1 sugar ABC transporter substrate-binding protein [Blautia sp. An46]